MTPRFEEVKVMAQNDIWYLILLEHGGEACDYHKITMSPMDAHAIIRALTLASTALPTEEGLIARVVPQGSVGPEG